jgi:hypothetical protein
MGLGQISEDLLAPSKVPQVNIDLGFSSNYD